MHREMVELIAVPDTFVTGVGAVESLMGGSCLRFYLYARQGVQRVVVAKLVMPAECLEKMIQQRQTLMAERSEQFELGLGLH